MCWVDLMIKVVKENKLLAGAAAPSAPRRSELHVKKMPLLLLVKIKKCINVL